MWVLLVARRGPGSCPSQFARGSVDTGRVRSENADGVLRVGLFVCGIAVTVLAVRVADGVGGRLTIGRAMVIVPLAAVAIWAIYQGIAIRERFGDRPRLVPKRRGRRIDSDLPGARLILVPESPPEPVELAGSRRLWLGLLALGLGVGSMLVAGGALLVAAPSDPGESMGAVAAFGLGAWAGLLAIRSVIGLATRRRAMVIDQDAISFGPAVGYIPALAIPRSEVVKVSQMGGLILWTDEGREHYITGSYFSSIDLSSVVWEAWPEWAPKPDGFETLELGVEAARVGHPGSGLVGEVRSELMRRMAAVVGFLLVAVIGAVAAGAWSWRRPAVPLAALFVLWIAVRLYLRRRMMLPALNDGAWGRRRIRLAGENGPGWTRWVEVGIDLEWEGPRPNASWVRVSKVHGAGRSTGEHDVWSCESDHGAIFVTDNEQTVLWAPRSIDSVEPVTMRYQVLDAE